MLVANEKLMKTSLRVLYLGALRVVLLFDELLSSLHGSLSLSSICSWTYERKKKKINLRPCPVSPLSTLPLDFKHPPKDTLS